METFEFAFAERYRPMLRLIGVTPNTALVTVSDDELRVRFSRWVLSTPIDNIEGLERSGDYHWIKAIGARGSFADRGVTFGTNTDAGVCVKFKEPVPALLPGGAMPHPGATVTVADPDGFIAAIESRMG
ncbi:MAG: hypothetical protein AAGK32_01530 [Actinomycetota bacterium]